MRTQKLLSGLLRVFSSVALVVSVLSGWLFYQLYFKWRSLFEEGRYFDPEESVVYHDSSFCLGSAFFRLALDGHRGLARHAEVHGEERDHHGDRLRLTAAPQC
jgi:hypothetical protein